MIKKTVSYEGFDGETITEDLYFNFNKAELMDLELSNDEGFSKKLQEVAEAKNVKEVLDVFKEIIIKAYGVRSEDGKRFIKNDKIREEFDGSEAYSEVLFDLLSDPVTAAKFMNGLMPKDLLEKAKAESGIDIDKIVSEYEQSRDADKADAPVTELRVVKDEEDLSKLTQEELIAKLKGK